MRLNLSSKCSLNFHFFLRLGSTRWIRSSGFTAPGSALNMKKLHKKLAYHSTACEDCRRAVQSCPVRQWASAYSHRHPYHSIQQDNFTPAACDCEEPPHRQFRREFVHGGGAGIQYTPLAVQQCITCNHGFSCIQTSALQYSKWKLNLVHSDRNNVRQREERIHQRLK